MIWSGTGCNFAFPFQRAPADQDLTPGIHDAGSPDVHAQDDGSLARDDRGADVDAGPPDAWIQPQAPCWLPEVLAGTVASYSFESIDDGVLTNTAPGAGCPDGKIAGDHFASVQGPEACGRALMTEYSTYAFLPASPCWQMIQGSIDFWVRLHPTDSVHPEGILSRDASQQYRPGHFTVFRSPDHRIVVRSQQLASGSVFLCSQPVAVNRWYHVGINFGTGGLELYLDGVQQNEDAEVEMVSETTSCTVDTSAWEIGLQGNNYPWVVGASAWNSTEGELNKVTRHLSGAIDQLRFDRQRRDFTSYQR